MSEAGSPERGDEDELPRNEDELPRLAWKALLALSAGAFALLLAFAWRNGYHRDELYFLEASRHLAWSYVDQPVGPVAAVGLSRVFFGDSPLGLRLFPALAFALTVFVTGLIARELGGRRFAQILAALLVGVSPFMAEGHLAGPTVCDLLAWSAASLLILRRAQRRGGHAGVALPRPEVTVAPDLDAISQLRLTWRPKRSAWDRTAPSV